MRVYPRPFRGGLQWRLLTESWGHPINRPYLKVVVGHQKHMKEALKLLDASRNPGLTNVYLIRSKPE